MAVRASVAREAATFSADVSGLLDRYPGLQGCVDEFKGVLKFELIPHVPVDPDNHPDVCFAKMDYPPDREQGLGRFVVTYHLKRGKNPMTEPWYTITLLTISVVE